MNLPLVLHAATALILLSACSAVIQQEPSGQTDADDALLAEVYGPPSQAGFGSAVFRETFNAQDSLEVRARDMYRYFVGDLWEQYGEDAWMGTWKEVYARATGEQTGIVDELRAITDPGAAISVPMILDVVENAENGRSALAAVFDSVDVADLRVYTLGDGEAMSGLLIAAARVSRRDAIFLIFLMD